MIQIKKYYLEYEFIKIYILDKLIIKIQKF